MPRTAESVNVDSGPLEAPTRAPDAIAEWVDRHLHGLMGDDAAASPRFRGGQAAADEALERFDVGGYASKRNVVEPAQARGASGLSPWIRHGYLPLTRVWGAVEGGPPRDVAKFRSELLWQEYARHLYARIGRASGRSLRFAAVERGAGRMGARASAGMACIERLRDELHRDGWIPNASRMWVASHWSVRGQGGWRDGEDRFFQHLLDGSRAANRLGWQWTAGAQTGRLYTFERGQVERQAPDWCRDCPRNGDCPIEGAPNVEAPVHAAMPAPGLGRVRDARSGAGPSAVVDRGEPEAVWLTAESLGHADPALAAHPELPVVFVFDRGRLARWRLSRKRLVFLVEGLAELAEHRSVALHVGDPARVLAGRPLAATHAPVPGWRFLATRLEIAQEYPWPWLVAPHAGSIGSFSAWRKKITPPRSSGPQQDLGL
ncbi:MAG: deoxyribodipyrimidine photolyase [bacterium]|nr:deoxyribodipyrimidine photolyase [bacterium]